MLARLLLSVPSKGILSVVLTVGALLHRVPGISTFSTQTWNSSSFLAAWCCVGDNDLVQLRLELTPCFLATSHSFLRSFDAAFEGRGCLLVKFPPPPIGSTVQPLLKAHHPGRRSPISWVKLLAPCSPLVGSRP